MSPNLQSRSLRLSLMLLTHFLHFAFSGHSLSWFVQPLTTSLRKFMFHIRMELWSGQAPNSNVSASFVATYLLLIEKFRRRYCDGTLSWLVVSLWNWVGLFVALEPKSEVAGFLCAGIGFCKSVPHLVSMDPPRKNLISTQKKLP